MAISERQMLANRRNALRSTGPRTAAGKVRVSKNRLRHGLTGVDPVLPEECVASFHLFEAEVNEHLDPRHPIEVMLAEQICSLLWRLRRIGRMEARIFELALERSPGLRGATSTDAAALQLADNPDPGLLTLSRYERSLRNSLVRALAEFRRVRSAHGELKPQQDGSVATPLNALSARPPAPNSPAPSAPAPSPEAPAAASVDLTIQTHLPADPAAPAAPQREARPAVSSIPAPTGAPARADDQTQSDPDQSQTRRAERPLTSPGSAEEARSWYVERGKPGGSSESTHLSVQPRGMNDDSVSSQEVGKGRADVRLGSTTSFAPSSSRHTHRVTLTPPV